MLFPNQKKLVFKLLLVFGYNKENLIIYKYSKGRNLATSMLCDATPSEGLLPFSIQIYDQAKI